MNKDAQNELNKMLSLMERMEKHLTLSEAVEEEKIEHTRETYTDLDQFLQDVNLGSSFVGLGYIQGYEAKKIYPTNPKLIKGASQADTIKAALAKTDTSSRLYPKLSGLVNDKEFTNPEGRAFDGFRTGETHRNTLTSQKIIIPRGMTLSIMSSARHHGTQILFIRALRHQILLLFLIETDIVRDWMQRTLYMGLQTLRAILFMIQSPMEHSTKRERSRWH